MMKYFGYILCFTIVVLSITASAISQESAGISGWHENDADVRFRIEKDYSHSLIPDVSLLDIKPDKKSKNVKEWIDKNRWIKRYQINGKLCQNILPSFGSSYITYNLNRDYIHFVARSGIVDRSDPNTSVTFEVYADKRLIFRVGPLTPKNPLTEINTAIPARSKQLRLITKAPKNRYLSRAKWVDPGFMLKGKYPEVSLVRLYAPGINTENFIPQVIATNSGIEVNSMILSAGPGEPMDILFASPPGNPSYLVYLIPKDKRADKNQSWEPKAGLVFETKWAKKGLRKSDRLPEFMKTFNGPAKPIGSSLVDDIHHAFNVHNIPEYETSRQGGYGFHRYKGFFKVDKNGKYRFATISRYDSYISVDDKLVVGWPGRHNINKARRGEKQGTITLKPGVHKLEYFLHSPWPDIFAVAAWKKPGQEFRVMTRTDFISVGRFRAVSADLNEPNQVFPAFEWSPIDDFRLEQTGKCFVTMQFDAIKPDPSTQYSYQWAFDDGTIDSGETVEHVFLRPGLRKVRLEIALQGKTLASTEHEVYVHPASDKCFMGISDTDSYDKVIRQRNLDKAPLNDLVNLFILADKAKQPGWKKLATTGLTGNLAGLVKESEDTDFIFEFGRYLLGPKLKQYDKSLELFNRLQQKSNAKTSVRQKAGICEAQILTAYFGKNDQALTILKQLPAANSIKGEMAGRLAMAKAQAMLGLGRTTEAVELIEQFSSSSSTADKTKLKVKHAGLIRHARVLAESQTDPNQLDFAMENIETVVTEDPAKIFSPGVNLVKLDIHLARAEFHAAFHLTEQLKNLQLSDYDIAEVLTRQVIASCGQKNLDKAKAVYAQLSKDYPYNPATEKAKQAIIQALGRQ
jgi:tetratricopeptide (TPR) repeat protein